jgi:hypothetical protein
MKKIFFVYSNDPEDLDLYKELKPYFIGYTKSQMLTIIDKEHLFSLSGDKEKAIEQLKKADLAIPLISVDYLNDDDCHLQLETAISTKIEVVPVLLRACLWPEFVNLKNLEKKILPYDGQTVTEHIKTDGRNDNIFTQIALLVKAHLLGDELKKIDKLELKSTPKSFYNKLAGFVLVLGITGFIISYSYLNKLTSLLTASLISLIAPLMSVVLAIVIYKISALPTKFKTK